MNPSLFIEYIDKYFRLVIGKITEKVNGKKTEEQLLHKTMLTEEYSPDLTWGSTELNNSIVAADVVALDSSLPLKRRDKISNASGVIPKIGIKFRKGEKVISDINVMRARGADEVTIAGKIFEDAPKAIKGIDVRKEIMFQQALSTGVTLVEGSDEGNTGTGVRADFGYLDENTFHATAAKWGETSALPQDDVQQLFDKAQEDGNSIGLVMMSKKYFNYFRNSTQGKRLAANYRNVSFDANTILPVPSRETMLEALADEFGAPFRVVDSSFKVEKPDGSRVSVKPWEEANIVALPGENVGRLVYGTLAEETNPVSGVNYQKSGSHTLVAKFSKTDPLEEFTSAQALVIPVIDGVDGIYTLHADSTAKISLDKDTLAFTKVADTTGKIVNVLHSEGQCTVASNETWCTAAITKAGKITVKVSANSETGAPARSATVTVTDADDNTATITVNQAANE